MRKRPLPRLAYEEIIQQLLLPVVKDSGIDTSIEYSEEDCSVEMTVRYAAPALDILEKGDELSLMLVQKIYKNVLMHI